MWCVPPPSLRPSAPPAAHPHHRIRPRPPAHPSARLHHPRWAAVSRHQAAARPPFHLLAPLHAASEPVRHHEACVSASAASQQPVSSPSVHRTRRSATFVRHVGPSPPLPHLQVDSEGQLMPGAGLSQRRKVVHLMRGRRRGEGGEERVNITLKILNGPSTGHPCFYWGEALPCIESRDIADQTKGARLCSFRSLCHFK